MLESVARLRRLMVEENLRQVDLAERTQYTPGTVSGYLKGTGSGPSWSFLKEVEKVFGWSAAWIESGSGSKRIHTNSRGSDIKNIQINPDDVHIPSEVAEAAALYNPDRTPFNVSNQVSRSTANMWLVPIRAQAGFAKRFQDPVFLNQMQRVPFPMVIGECYGFEVEGQSMEPRYGQFSWVVTKVINDVTWLAKGRNYVFQTFEGVYIKQFDRIEGDYIYMVSLNPEYNPVDPLPVDEVSRLYSIEGRFQPGE